MNLSTYSSSDRSPECFRGGLFLDKINPAITCFFSGKGEEKRENIRWKGMIPGKAEIGRTDFNSICHKSWRMEVSLTYVSKRGESP